MTFLTSESTIPYQSEWQNSIGGGGGWLNTAKTKFMLFHNYQKHY